MPLVGLPLDDPGIERPQPLVPDRLDTVDEDTEQFGCRFLAVAVDRVVRPRVLPGGLDAIRLFPFSMQLAGHRFQVVGNGCTIAAAKAVLFRRQDVGSRAVEHIFERAEPLRRHALAFESLRRRCRFVIGRQNALDLFQAGALAIGEKQETLEAIAFDHRPHPDDLDGRPLLDDLVEAHLHIAERFIGWLFAQHMRRLRQGFGSLQQITVAWPDEIIDSLSHDFSHRLLFQPGARRHRLFIFCHGGQRQEGKAQTEKAGYAGGASEGLQKCDQGLSIGFFQRGKPVAGVCGLAAMPENGFRQVPRAPVMEEERVAADRLRQSDPPERGRAPFAAGRDTHRLPIGKPIAHVMQQKIRIGPDQLERMRGIGLHRGG